MTDNKVKLTPKLVLSTVAWISLFLAFWCMFFGVVERNTANIVILLIFFVISVGSSGSATEKKSGESNESKK